MKIEEIYLVEEEVILHNLRKIVSTGLKQGIEKVAKDLHDFAASYLHRLKRGGNAHGILDKIIANPKIIAKQLIKQTIDKDLPVLQNVI